MTYFFPECRIPLSLLFVYLPGLQNVRKAEGRPIVLSGLGIMPEVKERKTIHKLITPNKDILVGVVDGDGDDFTEPGYNCSIFSNRTSYTIYQSNIYTNRYCVSFNPTLEYIIAAECKKYLTHFFELELLDAPTKIKRRMNQSKAIIEKDAEGKSVELRQMAVDVFRRLKNSNCSVFDQLKKDIEHISSLSNTP
jgi:hypothetical protein